MSKPFHATIVTALAGLQLSAHSLSTVDVLAKLAGATFIPPDRRDNVLNALASMKSRVHESKIAAASPTIKSINDAMTAISAQPNELPATNGHDTATTKQATAGLETGGKPPREHRAGGH